MNFLNKYIRDIIEVRRMMYTNRQYTADNPQQKKKADKGFIKGIKVIKKLILDCAEDIKKEDDKNEKELDTTNKVD